MQIGGDDISIMMFFNVCLHVHLQSFPFCADWQKSDSSVDGVPQGYWRLN